MKNGKIGGSLCILSVMLTGCFFWHAPTCYINCNSAIKPYLHYMEKPGVTNEQRREDCRACGGMCPIRHTPNITFPLKDPPSKCWSNPEHPEFCTDDLDGIGFSDKVIRSLALPGEIISNEKSPKDDLKATRDFWAMNHRAHNKWRECMYSKGYVWTRRGPIDLRDNTRRKGVEE